MRFSLKIAIRFLKSNKGQTLLIALGIAIGVSVQVFIGSLIQGLQKSLINKTIGNSSQITILSNGEEKSIENWQSIISKVKSSDERIKKISPAVDGPAFIFSGDKNSPILLRGFNIDDADKIYNIKSRIIEGSTPISDNDIIIGKELKKEMNLNINDKVIISTPKGSKKEVTIAGIYDLKISGINKSWVITGLNAAQNILNLNNKVTSIEMQVSDTNIFKADEISKGIFTALSSSDINVENWKDANAELLSGLSGQSSSSTMIQVFVLISVVLGIASVLAITVVQKSKQIGILKAMGIRDRAASLIFLFQGAILGLMGSVLGVLLGLVLMFSFTKFALNPDGSPVVSLYINYTFILVSAVIAVISATVASIIPARNSSKLNPIEVIKNG